MAHHYFLAYQPRSFQAPQSQLYTEELGNWHDISASE